MKLRCPILPQFAWDRKIVMLTQLFGENKNWKFYGAEGHQGIDFQTVGWWKYGNRDLAWDGEKWTGSFYLIPRDEFEQVGCIPICAAHDGYPEYYLKDKNEGWGVSITSKSERTPDEKTIQYRTLYWHVDNPWNAKTFFGYMWNWIWPTNKFLQAGSLIATGGNTGFPKWSTGPHLHFELQVRELDKFLKWSEWKKIDPMPYFDDRDLVYQRPEMMGWGNWFYKGKEVTKQEVDLIMANWPKVKK